MDTQKRTVASSPEPEPSIESLIRKLVREEVHAELAKATTPAAASYVSVTEYAKARSISVSTVRNAIRDGRLPAMKIGASVRVLRDAELGRPVQPKPALPTSTQIAERIIGKQHKRHRLVAV